MKKPSLRKPSNDISLADNIAVSGMAADNFAVSLAVSDIIRDDVIRDDVASNASPDGAVNFLSPVAAGANAADDVLPEAYQVAINDVSVADAASSAGSAAPAGAAAASSGFSMGPLASLAAAGGAAAGGAGGSSGAAPPASPAPQAAAPATPSDHSTPVANASLQLSAASVPDAPGVDVVSGDDYINLDERSVTVLTGTNDAAATVQLNISGIIVDATVTGTTWSYALSYDDVRNLGEGVQTLAVTQTDAGGNTSAETTHNFTIDTFVPGAPIISQIAGDDHIDMTETGSSMTGSAEHDSAVSVFIGSMTHAAVVDASGNWSYALTPDDIAEMGEGPFYVKASQTDLAGNSSMQSARILTIDINFTGVAVTGSAADETLMGGGGDDVITGNGGADSIHARGGNDVVVLNADNLAQLQGPAAGGHVPLVDGGKGIDTISLSGSSTTLDLTTIADVAASAGEAARITSVERIDAGTGSNTVKLSANDVLATSSSNLFNTASGWASADLDADTTRHQMVLDGDATATADIGAADWTSTGTVSNGGQTYNIYNSTTVAAQLIIDSRYHVI